MSPFVVRTLAVATLMAGNVVGLEPCYTNTFAGNPLFYTNLVGYYNATICGPPNPAVDMGCIDECACPPGNDGGGAVQNPGCPSCGSTTPPGLDGGVGRVEAPGGMPSWFVTEPYLNLWIRDLPLSYKPSRGPAVSVELSYKQREDAAGFSANEFSVGRQWNFSWLSFVRPIGWDAQIHLPGGGTLDYEVDGAPEFYTYTRLESTNSFYRLLHPDGRMDVYEMEASVDGETRYYLTESIDPFGQSLTFQYENPGANPAPTVVRLLHVVDADGRTNTVNYATSGYSTNLITSVEDAFGRTLVLGYDSSGRLTNLVDAAQITSSFDYATNDWMEALHTPYGTTTFTSTEDLLNGVFSLQVADAGGGQHLWIYRSYTTNLLSNSLPDLEPINNLNPLEELHGIWFRYKEGANSFYWGPQQVALLTHTNDLAQLTGEEFMLARRKHWTGIIPPSFQENPVLSMVQEPSPDGVTPGQQTWYEYAYDEANGISQIQPFLVMQLLPNGDTRYTQTARNQLGVVTNSVSTYSLPDGTVALRTNVFDYAPNGIDLVKHVGPDGHTEAGYAYNSNHQVLRHTNAVNEVTAYTYDAQSRLSSVRTPAGLTKTNIYYTSGEDAGWLEKTIDIEISRTNSYTWNNGLVSTHTDERGLTTTNTWDALQRLRRVNYPDGTSITNSYRWLDLVQVVDRMGYTNSYGYDSMRRLTDVTNALGAVTHYEYCTCGSLESTTDPLNNTTSYSYDLQGRATNIVYPGNISVDREFNVLGQLIRTTDAWGSETNSYNNQGLLVTVSNAFGQVSQTIYDIEDRVTTTVDANGVSVDMTHDDLGRVLTRTYPDNGVESFVYDQTGLVRYTNQLEQVTRYGNDAAGRRVAETNANNEGVSFAYSPAGDLLTLSDGNDHLTTWGYNEYGLVTNKVDDTDTEILRYAYDANGRLTNRWSAQKGNTRYTYDAVGNLTGVNYPASTNLAFSYDALNRLTNMVDGVGTTKYAYTALGQLESEDGPWADDTVSYTYDNRLRDSLSLLQPNASAWTQSYGYDSAKRLTNVTSSAGTFVYTLGGAGPASPLVKKLSLPGGICITNTFDSMARLLSTQLRNSSNAVLNSHAYGYNQGNQRTQQVFTAGNYTDYTYDAIGQLKRAKGWESGGSTARLNEQFGYKYDAAWNLNHRTNNALVQTFGVNSLNELTSATRSGTLTVAGTTTSAATNVTVNNLAAEIYGDHTFARAGFTVTNGVNSFTAVAQDAYGRVDTNSVSVNLPSSVSFQYDANGNLTNDGSRVFTYDDENQLTGVLVPNAWKSEFEYDGKMRRRIRREYTWSGSGWTPTNEVRYVCDGMMVIQERDGSNTPQVSYTRGTDLSGSLQRAGGIGGLLARSDHSTSSSQLATAFYHADGNGNVTALVNANGLIVANYHYDPYGNTLSASGPLAEANLYRFSSKEWHANAGLYSYGYRYYDANLQRWPNRDPLGELGGLNLYGFVQNAPTITHDPYGLQSFQDQLGGFNKLIEELLDELKRGAKQAVREGGKCFKAATCNACWIGLGGIEGYCSVANGYESFNHCVCEMVGSNRPLQLSCDACFAPLPGSGFVFPFTRTLLNCDENWEPIPLPIRSPPAPPPVVYPGTPGPFPISRNAPPDAVYRPS